jgi:hypothetical protein
MTIIACRRRSGLHSQSLTSSKVRTQSARSSPPWASRKCHQQLRSLLLNLALLAWHPRSDAHDTFFINKPAAWRDAVPAGVSGTCAMHFEHSRFNAMGYGYLAGARESQRPPADTHDGVVSHALQTRPGAWLSPPYHWSVPSSKVAIMKEVPVSAS